MRDLNSIDDHHELIDDNGNDKPCQGDGLTQERRERYRGGNTAPKITSAARAAKRKAKAKSQKRNR